MDPTIQVAVAALAIALGCPPDRVDEVWVKLQNSPPGYLPSDHVEQTWAAIQAVMAQGYTT
jgi:hypothetical protein